MADYYRDVIRLLKEGGFQFKRHGRGDHEVWWNPDKAVSVVVDRKLRSRFTANGILKEAGLPKSL